MVATSSPAAAQVGLRVMQSGGNAIDAAVAVAATLSVVEPTMNGVGGDLFALVWDGSQLHGLNASGRSPLSWSLARFAARGAIPELGWDSVTVPGAVSGWVALCERFGSRPFAELLAPAIHYARDGFPVLPKMAVLWASAAVRFAHFDEFRRVFLPHGRAPAPVSASLCPTWRARSSRSPRRAAPPSIMASSPSASRRPRVPAAAR